MKLKYGTWRVSTLDRERTQMLIASGISPLCAAVLVSRGYDTVEKARKFLASGNDELLDPFGLPDMDQAAERVKLAISRGEKIAVYGDYDVDGITATCLLTDYLSKCGVNCIWYIPARLEEGYGLNRSALDYLAGQNVDLIITVDCGITATEEAEYCRNLGMDLVITDHHECKEELPRACAVVNPHRRDSAYPFCHLAGVGVAFKLAAAVSGNQDKIFREYCDLVALGTVADVMPLVGENRVLVTGGIAAMQNSRRPGLRALMQECQITPDGVNSSVMGYTLAPRINASGRMGQVELAAELFLTDSYDRAVEMARELCRLNRQRQGIEAEIYADAVEKLGGVRHPDAIVLVGETWHQGVVGIVASRLAEDYGCPVFLICMMGDSGKASSRSYGGFPLFSTLDSLSHLLENFGGHELAAGFTIARENIDAFREAVCKKAAEYRENNPDGTALELDCAVSPNLLTVGNVTALDIMEPFGASCPRPLLYLDNMLVEQMTEVGGKHLKFRLSRDGKQLGCIFFSTTAAKAAVAPGDIVEVAFTPQINEYRGMRSVQLNVTDIRPAADTRDRMRRETQLYTRYLRNDITPREAVGMIPPRTEFAAVWRYLMANSQSGSVWDEFYVLSRKIARSANLPVSFMRTRVCLDVLAERGLIELDVSHKMVYIKLTPGEKKVDLSGSEILLGLMKKKEGDA